MEHSPRYLIGIDLGTTNSVVAYIDHRLAPDASDIRVCEVPQLVAEGEVRALPALPSFLYLPTDKELDAGLLTSPWHGGPPAIAGVLAREQGALVPGRQVSSAKSWLSNPAVDRRAAILPREAEPPLPRVSPVEASARYLMHLQTAWNHGIAANSEDDRFEKQDIVLTVPASFDEEARELTVEAAHLAGLETFTLLEEPLAAFYSWIASHRHLLRQQLRDDELVLICDIGGGTTDFSLVRARLDGDEVQFERIAIGEHLLLGGDNLDLALARKLEERLPSRLNLRQRQALRRACSAAKERLLSEPGLERVPINILGAGRSVVGQMVSTELTRDEVAEVVAAGFLPLTQPGEMPSKSRQAGLREIGLPYATDPAITRHLAAFLRQASRDGQMVRPDAVLFNGGFCEPALARERILAAIAGWFRKPGEDWCPKVLHNPGMDRAVARGAAHYGQVRRGVGLRIRAGSARTYYVGIRSEQGTQGVCVLPAGAEEGTTLPLANRDFAVLANRPVSFTLYSSRVRRDAHGEVAVLDDGEVHRHAPLVTLLRYGKKLRETELSIRLRATFTEVGTLELWCESLSSPHRWRLQFELRGEHAEADAAAVPSASSSGGTPSGAVAGEAVENGVRLLRQVLGAEAAASQQEVSPDALVSRLEETTGAKRDSWPVTTLRRFSDELIKLQAGRSISARHEVRWLNLAGFCLRPGFGAPGDAARIGQIHNLHRDGPVFGRDVQSRVEWLILLRRVAGGLNASQQQELYKQYSAEVRLRGKKAGRLKPQVEREVWRLLACLEHVPSPLRAALGDALLVRLGDDPGDASALWALARLGARIPLYGPLHCVVPIATAERWLKTLVDLPIFTAETAAAVGQLARRTDDSARDVSTGIRDAALEHMRAAGLGEDMVKALDKYVPPERADAARMFGEPLPRGLHLVTSPNCLLSVTALTSDPDKVA